MGSSISSLFGATDDELSEEYLQLTDLGGFLSKYIFIMLDKDKRKLVSKQEYLRLVNHFREQKTTEEELDNFLKRHIPEGQSTDYINESLFRKLILQLAMDFDQNVAKRMEYLMTLFDKDNDGFVSEVDLRQVYDAIGIQVPLEPIRSLISKYDLDGDSRLSVKEFEQLGRSAMSKLFVRKESPEEALVVEALRKVSESLLAEQTSTGESTTTTGFNADDIMCNNNQRNMDINNNPESGFMVVDNMLFSKPVVLKDLDTVSSIFADVHNTAECNFSSGETLGETSTNKVFLSESGDFEGKISEGMSECELEMEE